MNCTFWNDAKLATNIQLRKQNLIIELLKWGDAQMFMASVVSRSL